VFKPLSSISGNSLVLHLFSKTKDLKSPANLLVVNLAVSDLGMMITQFPMFFFNCFSGGVWIFGPFMCELYACTGSIFGLCSICTMAVVSYDRYNVIVNGMNGTPMSYGAINFCYYNYNLVRIMRILPYLFVAPKRKSHFPNFILLGLRNWLEPYSLLWLGQIYSGRHFGFMLL
jgi:hypothetical protein